MQHLSLEYRSPFPAHGKDSIKGHSDSKELPKPPFHLTPMVSIRAPCASGHGDMGA